MQRVRIFVSRGPASLESTINAWLAEAQPIVLFMTQSSQTDETVITFFYDEPQLDELDDEIERELTSGAPQPLAPEAELPY